MIESLLNGVNYQASKAILDVTAQRHRIMAGNLANVHTPGYQRIDVAESFKSELQSAIKNQDAAGLRQLGTFESEIVPGLAAESPDGNNVNLERELMYINQNAMEYEANTQFVSGSIARLKMAITGRTS
jgi:flagellar basal-body rod protein FlgB